MNPSRGDSGGQTIALLFTRASNTTAVGTTVAIVATIGLLYIIQQLVLATYGPEHRATQIVGIILAAVAPLLGIASPGLRRPPGEGNGVSDRNAT